MSSLLAKLSSLSTSAELTGWIGVLKTAVQNVLNPILVVACLVGVIYAIWIGITFAKADTSDDRKEAKQKLIYIIVGIVAAVALIILFYWLCSVFENNDFNWAWLDRYNKGVK